MSFLFDLHVVLRIRFSINSTCIFWISSSRCPWLKRRWSIFLCNWGKNPCIIHKAYNITETIHHVMSGNYQQTGNYKWAYTTFAQIVNISKLKWFPDSVHWRLKKCHVRLDSIRGKGSGFKRMVWIRTNVHGMKISCTFRNRLVSVDFDECKRGQVIRGHTPARCGGPVSGIPGETSCDPLLVGQTLGVWGINRTSE